MAKKYIEIGGPSDAELKKIKKESKDIYKIPLKELFKVDENIEVQDSACDDNYPCDSADGYKATNRIDRTYY
jgi:hypothetical protein